METLATGGHYIFRGTIPGNVRLVEVQERVCECGLIPGSNLSMQIREESNIFTPYA